MVGLPRKYLPLVQSIKRGHTLVFLFNFSNRQVCDLPVISHPLPMCMHLTVFLFHFSNRQLHGVYLATSDGQENLSLTAWKTLAPTPKMGRRDEQAGGQTLLEMESETDGACI